MHNRFNGDILALQKKAVSYAAFDYLGSGALFLAMCGGLLAVGLSPDEGQVFFVVMLICLTPAICFLTNGIRRLRLRKQMMSIKESDAQEIQITCRRVRFLLHPKNKQHCEITALVLSNEYDEVYTYVFPKGSEPLDNEKKLFKHHFEGGSVTFTRYCNTNFIQSLDLPKGETV